ncbi:hypothetical protein N7533_007129 [Penicillium manginii]|uniref:uncharacterized protein n=1 Tax=Penicillium manginii TaxID=203109 RepID=UPI0025487167|nr:uncharacterized protein N7533_007129 [Penicillium manginii]KAJ5750101.1 hypothetical protein N7533_007129 [Penicillium manginii]
MCISIGSHTVVIKARDPLRTMPIPSWCVRRSLSPHGLPCPELAWISEITRPHPASSAVVPRVPLPDPHSPCALTGRYDGGSSSSSMAAMVCLSRFQSPV